MELQPYKHNCRTCQWVGWVTLSDRMPPANVYICGDKTVVIRFSDEPGDYCSLEGGGREPSALGLDEELAEKTLKLVAGRKAQCQ